MLDKCLYVLNMLDKCLYVLNMLSSVNKDVVIIIIHSYSISDRNSCKQTVKILIRRRVLRLLIRVCTVCLCPKKGC